jgi:anaerobic selenocysteine-containing dehydrogenase
MGYLQAEPFLRWAPPVVAPVGQRRPQWWIFAELAGRLGLPRHGSPRRDAALADRIVDDEAIAAAIMGGARRPWAEVRAAPHGIRDTSVAPGWLVPQRLPQRIDLAPAELVDQFAEAHRALTSAGTSAVAPSGAELVLVNRRTAQQYNTLHREVQGRGRQAAPTLLVHPDDAARCGLTAGDLAEVRTADGACRAVVETTDAIRRGVVSLPAGFDTANANLLTSTSDADRLSGMTVVSGIPVAVSRVQHEAVTSRR